MKDTDANQRRTLIQLYRSVLDNLDKADEDKSTNSPIQVLLAHIKHLAHEKLNVENEKFENWLESITCAQLEDSPDMMGAIDNLDQLLINTIVEIENIEDKIISRGTLELRLSELWNKSLAAVVSEEEQRLERLILVRGRALHEEVYKDSALRRRLYMIGLPPHAGSKFEATAEKIHVHLQTGEGYGEWPTDQRKVWVQKAVDIIRQDAAFGFKSPQKDVQKNWKNVLSWWLGLGGDAPTASKFGNWMQFVQEQFEFRSGTAISSVLANIWDREGKGLSNPSPSIWKEKTGLPWAAYWIQNILRWGILDPLGIDMLSSGHIIPRKELPEHHEKYRDWLRDLGLKNIDDLINPELISAWKETIDFKVVSTSLPTESPVTGLKLDSKFEGLADKLMVWPCAGSDSTFWFEPAGYLVGKTTERFRENLHRSFFTVDLTQKTIRWQQT